MQKTLGWYRRFFKMAVLLNSAVQWTKPLLNKWINNKDVRRLKARTSMLQYWDAKWWKMPFWRINVQSLYLLILFIRAFSVFLHWDRTMKGNPSCVLKRPVFYSNLFFFFFLNNVLVLASNSFGFLSSMFVLPSLQSLLLCSVVFSISTTWAEWWFT